MFILQPFQKKDGANTLANVPPHIGTYSIGTHIGTHIGTKDRACVYTSIFLSVFTLHHKHMKTKCYVPFSRLRDVTEGGLKRTSISLCHDLST